MAASLAPRSFVKGEIVLVMYPFAEIAGAKRRPAVVVSMDAVLEEITLAFVTSQNTGVLQRGEIAVLPAHVEFQLTGFTVPSKIRATKLATLKASLITRRLGKLGSTLMEDLDNALIAGLDINTNAYEQYGVQRERTRLSSLGRVQGTEAVLADLGLSTS